MSVCHFISLRGGSWSAWELFIYFLTHSLLSLLQINMAMYQTVSKQFPCLFLPDFPFLDSELIYATSECPELGETSKRAQSFFFFQSCGAFSLWLNIDGRRKAC